MIARAGLAGILGLCFVQAVCFRCHAEETATAAIDGALAAAEARQGKTSPYLLPVIEELAQLRQRQGELGEAAALRRRALDIAVGNFRSDSPSAAEAMAALAAIEIDRRRYLDAEPLLIIAENVLSAWVAPDHPAMVTVLAGRSRVALARGDKGPAEAWARRAVEMARHNPHRRSTEALRALGAALTAEDKFAEAEPLLREALTQDREQHGDGADTARSLALLAHLYWREEQSEKALPLIEEAAAIDQVRLGATHPFVADDFFDLALVYDALRRDDAALRALQSARATLERGAGRETVRAAYVEIELSRLYRERGRDAEADAAFHDARRILNKAEAEEHKREREV
ncbi:MAG TPA: tetratricopeptide repeat protein [Stellaceae bacterium]